MLDERWLLPEGIEEILPPEARWLEQTRLSLMDLYDRWGYELVIPPLVEYLESLLLGTGHDLDLKTFKITDQLTGRTMGIRADMTPQIAAIDGHILKRSAPTRLCYFGSVLHTLPESHGSSRSPFQSGLELYGHRGWASDLEVVTLMLQSLQMAGIDKVHLDLGHVGIFRRLAEMGGLNNADFTNLFDILQRKSRPEAESFLAQAQLPDSLSSAIIALIDLNGDEAILETAATLLPDDEGLQAALAELTTLASHLRQRNPDLELHLDLAELRGFNYHTGTVYAAYTPGHGQAIAQGGRYDNIRAGFDTARPATGFSTDLRVLMGLTGAKADRSGRTIFAPASPESTLVEEIDRLRSSGERVIQALEGQQADARAMGCDHQLVNQENCWKVEAVG